MTLECSCQRDEVGIGTPLGTIPVSTVTMGSASAMVALLPPGVLAIKLGGVLTTDGLTQMRREVASRHGHGVRVYVVDYRDVLVALGASDLDAAADGAPVDLPGAVVVDPAHMWTFCQHAKRQASIGLVRRVFPEAGAAFAWAVRQAYLD